MKIIARLQLFWSIKNVIFWDQSIRMHIFAIRIQSELIMIKEFITLFFVLVLGFICWGVYERTQWPIDYSQYSAESVKLPPLDKTFEKHIFPKFFENAQVITDPAFLRYPEDMAVANDGTIYTGLSDGTIAIINSTGSIQTFYKFDNTSGIYGIILTSDETTLYFVTEFQGLIKLDIQTKTPTFLMKGINGKDFAALNNLCIDEENQIIYVTDATSISMRFSNKEVLYKHREGRIISYNLRTGEAAVVLSDIAFPNGIVYEQSTKSIIFSELNRHRIVRYYVDGPKKGTQENLVENLFGFGDNMKLNEKGELLVAIPATRDEALEYLNQKPELRKLLIYLPERLIYVLAKKRAGGVRIDTKTGQITEYLFGAPTKAYFFTTVLEKNNKLYFSSLKSPTILVLDRNHKGTAPGSTQL